MTDKLPYIISLATFLKNEKNLSQNTIDRIIETSNHFWNFYSTNSSFTPLVKDISSNDVREYLVFLEANLHLKTTTINKHLSYLRNYLNYLYEHNLIDKYPLVQIKGKHYTRQHLYIVNWMSFIPQIAHISNIHFETIILLTCVSLGLEPKNILQIKYSDLIEQIHDTWLKNYIEKRTNFTFFTNPYLLQTSTGGHYATEFNIQQKIKNDRDILNMPLNLEYLRRSYIYSILQKDYSDEVLISKLHLSMTSLLNYKKNLIYYVKVKDFSIQNIKKTRTQKRSCD